MKPSFRPQVFRSALLCVAVAFGAQARAVVRDEDALIDLRFEGHFASEAKAITDVGHVRPFTGEAAPRFTDSFLEGRALRFEPVGEEKAPTVLAFNASRVGVASRLHRLASFTFAGWWRFDDFEREPVELYRYGDKAADGYGVTLTPQRCLALRFPDGSEVVSEPIPRYGTGKWIFLAVTYRGGAEPRVEFFSGRKRNGRDVARISAHAVKPQSIVTELAAPQFGDVRRAWRGALDTLKLYGNAESATAALTERDLQKIAGEHETALPLKAIDPKLRKSDVVVMRSDSAVPVVAYGATRVAWNYQLATGLVESYAALGVSFSQTLNLLNQRPLHLPLESGRAINFDGNITYHHHSKKIPYSAAVEEMRNDITAHYHQRLLRTRPASIQNDNPMMDRHANHLGAHSGFEAETLVALKEHLRKKFRPEELRERFGIEDLAKFDFREWLRQHHDVNDAASYRAKAAQIPLVRELEEVQEDRIFRLLSDLRALTHTQPSPILLSANVLPQHRYYRRLLNAVDFICSETPRPFEKGEPDVQDIVTSKFIESVGRDMIAVNGHTWTHDVMTRGAVNLNRMLAAAIYAHGQIMMVPWDIWAGYSHKKEQHIRYYGDPADYAAMFRWIRENARYFDDYEALATVGLIWNTDTNIRVLHEPALRLLKQHVPFALLSLGERYPDCTFDPEKAAANLTHIATVSPLETWNTPRRAVVTELAGRKRLLSIDEILSQPSPIKVEATDADRVWISPRRHERDANAPLVLHVLNRRYRSADDSLDRSTVQLQISSELVGFTPGATAIWTSHDGGRHEVRIDSRDGWHRIALPELPCWSLLVLHRASASAENR